MSHWITLVITLAGVNLARATGRGFLVAMGAVMVLAAMLAFGEMFGTVWWPVVASVLLVAAVVMTWHHLVLARSPRWLPLGLFVFVAGCAGQIVLLHGTAPAVAKSWPWAAAFLLLAEPATRFLRWVMELMGRTPNTVSLAYGRGEAIGVLERWIALVVITRGDYTALGFIIAAKALARHKRFEDDPEFAEYFLVGTLTSMLMAIAAAETLRGLGIVS